MATHPIIVDVTQRIRSRSQDSREAYLQKIKQASNRPRRSQISCGNLAHASAACNAHDKSLMARDESVNIGIVTSYNDMLSAHQPFQHYPDLIKEELSKQGATGQVAGGVPAMCDGVTQGRAGMELSLFSRDVIAQATAVALSHDVFDGVMCLGVCDKIVPGMLMGALAFGHLPLIFVPAGPMPTGLPNDEKQRVRQQYADGKASRVELLRAESASYHSPGTCTFYGTANSNQMLMEMLGLQLSGASFVQPDDPLRPLLTRYAAQRVVEMAKAGVGYRPAGEVVNEHAIVNAIIGLLATGGSTNHTLHLVAMARSAGILINWDDFADLSAVIPLLARVYPNGAADVNDFCAAGGLQVVIAELLDAGLLNETVETVMNANGVSAYTAVPRKEENTVTWVPVNREGNDPEILATVDEPFASEGGVKVLDGNLGRAIVKVSAVAEKHRVVRAPAVVFDDQQQLLDAFNEGLLDCDFVAVVRYQGPKANGMPELHKLTPPLAVLQNRGFHVALVTDGRMSGASGKVPAAIHITPECLDGGPLAKVRNGDLIELDCHAGTLYVVDVEKQAFETREVVCPDLSDKHVGTGRELFGAFRQNVSSAEEGACTLFVS